MIIDPKHVPVPAPGGTPSPDMPVPGVGAAWEQELGSLRSSFLRFGSDSPPFLRDVFRRELAADLARYLEHGWFAGDDATGPVQRLSDSLGTRLALRDGVVVFGFLDYQMCGDCYYVCRPEAGERMFFSICIGSSDSLEGLYEIDISAGMDWDEFKRHLPPT